MPVLVVNKHSKTYQPRYSDYIINWGGSKKWDFITHAQFSGNKIAVDKLKTFEEITAWNAHASQDAYINIPEWTTDPLIAQAWNKDFVARTTLTGHSGQGIEYVLAGEQAPPAPLYVQYKKKKHEYRVHVFNGSVIDVTQKKKRKDAEFVDTKIRNHGNGWVYCREAITVADELVRTAKCAISALGLQFGAVDVIHNAKEDKYYVLEVNTAPGLVGQTLEAYKEAFLKDIQNGY